MRNLKKFLALVLAMVMAMSLMLTANAASTKNGTDVYPDGENVLDEFQTAVDVLYGMGVMKGDNGNFKPQASIMRCEAVAILYRLVTGDVKDTQADLYKPLATQFKDVDPDAWYAGYVGFAVDAQLINGYNGNFMPTKNVTGYEMLKMLLKAVGYGKNGEYTGSLWRINVGSDAQRLHILDNIASTHYATTLSQYSPREVVADLTFQTAWLVPTVRYELGYYNQYIGVATTGGAAPVKNPTLGQREFGLAHKTDGVVIGNQDTGESRTVVGTQGSVPAWDATNSITVPTPYTAYTWAGTQIGTVDGNAVYAPANERYNVVTGVEMMGRQIDLWYCSNGAANSNFNTNDVYAYYDASTMHEIVELATADTLAVNTPATATTLGAKAAAAGFTVTTSTSAVFNDYFGLFGPTATKGDGKSETTGTVAKSPNNLYLLISNSPNKALDVVIPLNVETSRITESNAVRGIPTVAVPVADTTNDPRFATTPAYINAGNVATVNTVSTGILAQAALVHDSTSTLGDYEMGVHINGTTPRTVGAAETTAILGTGAETGWFLLNKVDEFVTGKVIAYNTDLGTVTLDVNGQTKVLNRSQFYDTVVCTNAASVSGTVMPQYALPQSVALLGAYADFNSYEESYNFADYKFYLDYAGNYLGAERTFPNDFFYGTYLDYEQKTSSSTFKYYLTGVTLEGKMETREVGSFYTWDPTQGDRVLTDITGTDDLGVPFRDSTTTGGLVNGLNTAQGYIGYTYTSGAVDPNLTADLINVTDYASNMARLGVIRAMKADATFPTVPGATPSNGMMYDITIGDTAMTLGAVQTEVTGVDGAAADSNLYLTEDTKIILVSGYGEDSCKPEVYNGISDLVTKNEAKSATIHLNVTTTNASGDYTGWMNGTNNPLNDTPYAAMTYFMKDPDVFNQSGQTAERVAVVILPKAAVTFDKSTSATFFMGDPHYSNISSHAGTPIYQYTVYDMKGDSQQVWLTNVPYDTVALDGNKQTTTSVVNDTFLTLGNAVGTASDGKPIYTATFDTDAGAYGVFSSGTRLIDGENAKLTAAGTPDAPTSTVIYQTTTRDALTATFGWCNSGNTVVNSAFLRVQGANVTNLNAANSPAIGTGTGYVWPGITDLATLNAAGSINPVTGTPVRVAAVVSGLTVTQIFVCWDQNASA